MNLKNAFIGGTLIIMSWTNFNELCDFGQIELPDYHQETYTANMSSCESSISTSGSNMRY